MRAVETQGVGLHSGVPVKLRLTPAPAATGIVFRRTDLDDFEVPASWRYVQKVSYATSLMRQGVLISTTEHLLSTFYSMGIDNAFVEIDHPVAGRFRYPGPLVRLTATPPVARRAPLLGEHNEEILCGRLGYSRDELAALRAAGVI